MERLSLAPIETLPIALQILLILVVAIVAAKAIELLGYGLLNRSEQRTTKESYQIILEEIHLPLYATVILVGIYASAQLLPTVGISFYIAAVATSLILVLWVYTTIRLSGRIIGARKKSPTSQKITPILKNVLTFFIIVAGFLLLLSIWNVSVTPFLASAGILGIVLGIAAQDSLGNFFSGISLYLDNTYKLGDMIQLESGERGNVVDMSIRSTTILTRDNIAITVPNSELNSTQVVNESAPVRRRRIRLDVDVAYDSDLALVEETLLDIADNEPLVLETPSSAVRFQAFDDSGITAQLQCHIKRPGLRSQAKHQLIQRIDDRFREESIKIPFPQREVSFFNSGNTVRVGDAPDNVPESGGSAVNRKREDEESSQ